MPPAAAQRRTPANRNVKVDAAATGRSPAALLTESDRHVAYLAPISCIMSSDGW
jgi:hypothetical protein